MTFQDQYSQYAQDFNTYAESYFLKISDRIYTNTQEEFSALTKVPAFRELNFQNGGRYVQASQKLLESMRYSFFSGGKRFRPVLCLSLAEALSVSKAGALAWALAVECIHTYSLIHDDLPSLDNDDLRRGQPTNHKVYGEDIAILAGDALLTMAFEVLSQEIGDSVVSKKLSHLLSREVGFWGMISGQTADISLGQKEITVETLLLTHRNKTSALFEACCRGVGFLQSAALDRDLKSFGLMLGLGFQIADDLMDYNQSQDANNIVSLLGEEKTESVLEQLTQQGLLLASTLSSKPKFLEQLISFNRDRKI